MQTQLSCNATLFPKNHVNILLICNSKYVVDVLSQCAWLRFGKDHHPTHPPYNLCVVHERNTGKMLVKCK